MAASKKSAHKAEDMFTQTQKTLEAQAEKLGKSFEELAAFSQENLDAMVKSTEIAAKAAEELNAGLAAFSLKSFEDSMAAAKDLASAKTPVELFEKQAAFATAAFEGLLMQAGKWGETMADTAKEASAPLAARANAALDLAKNLSA